MTDLNPAFDIDAIAQQLEERGNALLDAARVLRRVCQPETPAPALPEMWPDIAPAAPPPVSPARESRPTPKSAPAKKATGPKDRVGRPGAPGPLSTAEGGAHTCGSCGREGLRKTTGPGGWMAFHHAPCGLPCNGANLTRLDDETSALGTHSKKGCPKCKAAA